ncbi:MAG: cysteine rich repeat-containing protein [Pseudomonadota bacterium]|nr:cysteine rich repeat-containing protein [Pseudomonadota bacterium]
MKTAPEAKAFAALLWLVTFMAVLPARASAFIEASAIVPADDTAPIQATPVDPRQACSHEVQAYCQDIRPGGGRIAGCLMEHINTLSQACRSALNSLPAGTAVAAPPIDRNGDRKIDHMPIAPHDGPPPHFDDRDTSRSAN